MMIISGWNSSVTTIISGWNEGVTVIMVRGGLSGVNASCMEHHYSHIASTKTLFLYMSFRDTIRWRTSLLLDYLGSHQVIGQGVAGQGNCSLASFLVLHSIELLLPSY